MNFHTFFTEKRSMISIPPIHPSWYEHVIQIELGYQGPFMWRTFIDYLHQRAIPGVETIIKNSYYRTVYIPSDTSPYPFKGWIKVDNHSDSHQLIVQISISLYPRLNEIIQHVRHQFDLDVNPESMHQILGEDWVKNGLRLPGAFDGFELSVRAILGQQITVKVATTLSGRLVHRLGIPFNVDIAGLTHFFPLPETFVSLLHENQPIEDVLGPLGITRRRSHTIAALAKAVVNNDVTLTPIVDHNELNDLTHISESLHSQCASAEQQMHALLKIKGIGNWTAHYIAMRALGYPDSFLETDIGIKRAMPNYESPKERLKIAEQWRPLRSYAVVNLWNSIKP